MYHLPGVWKVSATHMDNPRATPISMAYIGNRFILLEKDELSDSCRCIFQIHFGEEIAQLHFCSCVHITIYDCHRIRFTSSDVTIVHATIPKNSNNSCNITASHTKQAAQIIQDLMDLLREWLQLLRS